MMPAFGSGRKTRVLATVTVALMLTGSLAAAQSGSGQSQSPPSGQAQEIPDAPSAVQPPEPKPTLPPANSSSSRDTEPLPEAPAPSQPSETKPAETKPAPATAPPAETAPAASPDTGTQNTAPKNQLNPKEDLYKISVTTNFVQIPVMVKDGQGRRVDGLLPNDFTVLENGKPQKLTYFTSDPFLLSVAIVLDLGMADMAVQKVNQTYSSLVGAFSPYDEFALYTYSSTVTQVTDFTRNANRLMASLDSMKLVRGHENGPPVLGGPLGPQPPMVNGIPVGSSGPPPVYTPAKESHVLNDAILRAAIDLSKRDRARRKVILIISDGRERGSQAGYKDVLRVLQTHGIQVKAVVLDQGALPVYKQVEKIHHIWGQGYADILPKYTNASGGGNIFAELSRNAIEDAYSEITSEARNQYTLGYSPQAIKGGSPYRSIEVLVDKKGLNIYTKSGYYPVPTAR